MPRICLVLALLSLAVAGGAAGGVRAAGDGSLTVSAASGTIVLQGSGVIYGHFDQGTMLVLSYRPDDGVSTPSVSNSKAKLSRGTGLISGSDVRFLLPSGRYSLELIASGVDLSAVGRGTIVATGAGEQDATTTTTQTQTTTATAAGQGWFSVNGGKPVPLGRLTLDASFGGR